MSRIFEQYGEFCATHPYEVIFAVVTLTTSFLTIERSHAPLVQNTNEQFNAINVVCMTVIRCFAILYSYHQFRNLKKLGSNYILGIAGLFVVFASFVFTSTVLNLMQIEFAQLKDALFFFLLLIDLSKAATLAQFALTATSKEEISLKIARGISVLGPHLTLDTIVETLVIGVGTLSGVDRLEIVSYFACLSVIVNYIIFMTVYPACLSLMLELVKITNYYDKNHPVIKKLLLEEHEKSNPAVQRVKIIMSMGLMIVHIYSRWTIDNVVKQPGSISLDKNVYITEDTSFYSLILKQLQISLDHIVILTLLITLMIKFIFFESKDNIREQIKQDTLEELQKKIVRERRRTISSSVEVQTECCYAVTVPSDNVEGTNTDVCRKLKDCLEIFRSKQPDQLSDNEIMLLVDTKHIPPYDLEKALGNPERGVKIRRKIIQNLINSNALETLPYREYDYSKVMGACCENVVGYVPLPLGVAGPLNLDGNMFYIPMATTEGCLVASTNRGCKAVEKCGITSRIVADGMTRGPVVRFCSVAKASEAMAWINNKDNYALLKESFDSTSRFARLLRITMHIAGRYLFIRFVAETGDAMGMNMVSKGTEQSLKRLHREFPEMEVLSLSGNVCTDKKPSALNWIQGRGKSVVCEAIIPADVVSSVLKTNSHTMVDLNLTKNMIGSAMAGSIGGFNAHAANVVTAMFIATGQDPAQNVSSSNCITIMEPWAENGQDLYISCTMPSLEIGTIGGGTILPAQSACLDMLGVKGPHATEHGRNAKQLARVICGAVLAAELSLMAALASGHLVKSHLKYNRSYSEKDSLPASSSCDT
ncbi:unnamed protein product [Brassicogethes aeneus]|uniref:3-hydroxy-3-methylglutaryl coenzyme A reductase n=1 Tax=Brassicogethes aeneus TaxID=1431903 RepID=A0A9P0AZF6_BRAAE|nr:unnamed protein product [Brassicogethes aeneus]